MTDRCGKIARSSGTYASPSRLIRVRGAAGDVVPVEARPARSTGAPTPAIAAASELLPAPLGPSTASDAALGDLEARRRTSARASP